MSSPGITYQWNVTANNILLADTHKESYVTNYTNGTSNNNNSTSIIPLQYELVYDVGWSAVIAVILSLLTIGCILGNTLVILAVLAVKKLKTPSNYLIVSLAVSDWLVGVLVMPYSMVYELLGKWPLGGKMCSMWVTFDVMLCTASILNLMMISIDRYLVITRPFIYGPKRTTRLMIMYIAIAWVVSVVISITPMVVGWNTEYVDGLCIINQEIGYQIYATLAAFYLPLGVMIALYGRIFFISARIAKQEAQNNPTFQNQEMELEPALNNNSHIPECDKSDTVETQLAQLAESENGHMPDSTHDNGSSHNGILPHHGRNGHRRSTKFSAFNIHRKSRRRNSRSNSQAIRTLGVIMGLFTACWLPFFILAVIRPLFKDPNAIPMVLTSLLTWFGYVNSCLNPLIYARFNREFRTPFKEILCCRCRQINQSVRQTDYQYRYGD